MSQTAADWANSFHPDWDFIHRELTRPANSNDYKSGAVAIKASNHFHYLFQYHMFTELSLSEVQETKPSNLRITFQMSEKGKNLLKGLKNESLWKKAKKEILNTPKVTPDELFEWFNK